MLKHYFCKYTIDRDTLFCGSYSLSFICEHIGLCAFTFILVDQFCIMFYPCPSVFPSVMFWFPFNNLSLPWTWSNVLKFGCVKNHKRPVNFDFYKSMLKHYFCKYTIDRDTLFCGSYSLSFICEHIGLCAFTFILVDQFCIMFYPCPSVFPSVMFWFPFNNLSLPWTWSNVLKFGCVKNHKRPFFFSFYYIFCW